MAVMLLVLCVGSKRGVFLSYAAKRRLARWQEFERTTRSYRERADYIKQMSVHIIAEADRAIKQAVKEKNYEWAHSLSNVTIEKIDTIIGEISHLTPPVELIQFHRKRIELHLYQRKFYEAFQRGDPALELTNRRMCLVLELQSLQELRRLYVDFLTPPTFIVPIHSSIVAIQNEIARFDNPKELKKFNFPLVIREED